MSSFLTNNAVDLPELATPPAAPDAGRRKLYMGDDQILYAIGNSGEAVPIGPPPAFEEPRTETFSILNDNLDNYTQIAFGQRLILRFQLTHETNLALVNFHCSTSQVEAVAVGGATINKNWEVLPSTIPAVLHNNPGLWVNLPSVIATTNHETCRVSASSATSILGPTSTKVLLGQPYTIHNAVLGYYATSGGLAIQHAGGDARQIVESCWLTDNVLNVGIRSVATTGGPFPLGNNIIVLY